MYNNGNSSKNVTGSSIVDGTVETVDIADDAVTADKLANSVNTDIATGVSGSTTAGDALPKAGGAMTGAITTNSTFDGRDVATDGAALDVLDLAINSAADAAAITIDVNESVGVGTASPDSALHVYKQTNDRTARFQRLGGQYVDMYQTSGINSLRSIGKNFEISTEDAQSLLFTTNGSERMRVLSSGGITFNGDTAAANALDDYEEGTWTPAFNQYSGSVPSFTGFSSSGKYTKVGNMVFLSGYITYTSFTGGAGFVRIDGLPYNYTGSSSLFTGSVDYDDGYQNSSIVNGTDLGEGLRIRRYTSGSTSSIKFGSVDNATTNVDDLTWSSVTSSGSPKMFFTITYSV